MQKYLKESHDQIKLRVHYVHKPIPHFHDAIELIFMLDGTITAYCNGTPYQVGPGDVFFAGSNVIHSYNHTGVVNSILLIADPALLQGAASLFVEKHPVNPVWSDPNMTSRVWDLIRHAVALKPHIDQQTLVLLLSAIISIMVKDLDMKKTCDPNRSAQGILDYCKHHYLEPITIDQVAKALLSSKSHISHTFSNVLNISFPDYINILRLGDAVKLMEDPQLSLVEIAAASGFSSLRNFSRVFAKHYGTSPAQYRRQKVLSNKAAVAKPMSSS